MFPEMRDTISYSGTDENSNALFYQFLNEPINDFMSDSPSSLISPASQSANDAKVGTKSVHPFGADPDSRSLANNSFADSFVRHDDFNLHEHTSNLGQVPLSPTSTGSHHPHQHLQPEPLMADDYMSILGHAPEGGAADLELLEPMVDDAFVDPVALYNQQAAAHSATENIAHSEQPKSALSAQLAQLADKANDGSFAWTAAATHDVHRVGHAGNHTDAALAHSMVNQPHSVHRGGPLSVGMDAADLVPRSVDINTEIMQSFSNSFSAYDSAEPLSPTARPPGIMSSSFSNSFSRPSSVTNMRIATGSAAAPISIAGSRRDSFAGVFKGTPTLRSRQSSVVAASGFEYSTSGDFNMQSTSVPVKDLSMRFSSSTRESSPAVGSASSSFKDEPPRRKHSAANIGNGQAETECSNCSTKNTPLWRRNPEGEPLCNACGLFLKLHGETRPLRLKSDVIKKRNRSSNKTKRRAEPKNTPNAAQPDAPAASSASSTSPAPVQEPTKWKSSAGAATSPASSPASSVSPRQAHETPLAEAALAQSAPKLTAVSSQPQPQSPQSQASYHNRSAEFQQRSDLYNQRIRSLGSTSTHSPTALSIQRSEATTATTNTTASSASTDGKWDWLRIH